MSVSQLGPAVGNDKIITSADQIDMYGTYYMPSLKFTGKEVLTSLLQCHWHLLRTAPYPGPVVKACSKSKAVSADYEKMRKKNAKVAQGAGKRPATYQMVIEMDAAEEDTQPATSRPPRTRATRDESARNQMTSPVQRKKRVRFSSVADENGEEDEDDEQSAENTSRSKRARAGQDVGGSEYEEPEPDTKKRASKAPAANAASTPRGRWSNRLPSCVGCKIARRGSCRGQHNPETRVEGEACKPCADKGDLWAGYCANNSWPEEMRKKLKGH